MITGVLIPIFRLFLVDILYGMSISVAAVTGV